IKAALKGVERMSVESKQDRECLVVRVSGELDLRTAGELKSEVDPVLERAPERPVVVLDLSDVSFMDSSGMGAILGRYRTVSQMGGKLVVCGLTPQLRKLFELTGLMRIIPVYASVDDAISSLRGGSAGAQSQ
ncbi:MAG: anti-sigma factor antagonist, partial [Bacillota bacterium]